VIANNDRAYIQDKKVLLVQKYTLTINILKPTSLMVTAMREQSYSHDRVFKQHDTIQLLNEEYQQGTLSFRYPNYSATIIPLIKH